MDWAFFEFFLLALHVVFVVQLNYFLVKATDALLVDAIVSLRVHWLLLKEVVVVVEREVHLTHQQVGQLLSQIFHLFLLAFVNAETGALALKLPLELLAKLYIAFLLYRRLQTDQQRLLPKFLFFLTQLKDLLDEPANAELAVFLPLMLIIAVVGLLETLPLLHALYILSDLAVNEPAQYLCVFP